MKALTKETIEAIRQMKRDGAKVVEIMAAFGISKSAVHSKAGDIRSLRFEPEIDRATIEYARQMKRDGATYPEIAEKCGISSMSVLKHTRGVKPVRQRGQKKSDEATRLVHLEMYRLRQKGVKLTELSEKFGFHKHHISFVTCQIKNGRHHSQRAPS